MPLASFCSPSLLAVRHSLWFADRAGSPSSLRVVGDKSCFSALKVDISQLSSLQIAEICRVWLYCERWEEWVLVLIRSSHSGQSENASHCLSFGSSSEIMLKTSYVREYFPLENEQLCLSIRLGAEKPFNSIPSTCTHSWGALEHLN